MTEIIILLKSFMPYMLYTLNPSKILWILFLALLVTPAKAQQVQIPTDVTPNSLNPNFHLISSQLVKSFILEIDEADLPIDRLETFVESEFTTSVTVLKIVHLAPANNSDLFYSGNLTATPDQNLEPQHLPFPVQLSQANSQTQPREGRSQHQSPPAQAPENITPRTRPIEQPSQQQPTTPVEPDTPSEPKRVNTQIDYVDEFDNFGLRSRFFEQITRFPLRNDNQISLKTGFNLFDEIGIEAVTSFPIQVGWQGAVGPLTLEVAGGVDLFDRLPTEPNFNARLDAPLSPNFTLSAVVDQGPYKYGAKSLANQISAWRYGLDLAWNIDRNTDLSSSFRWGNYNDGNYEEESNTRLESRFGQFFLAGNLFLQDYKFDVEEQNGYFSPAAYLFYTGELGWEGEIIKALRCRLAAHLGQERFNGDFTLAAGYEASCTAKLSSRIELDLGYFSSTLYFPEEIDETEESFTSQLRINF